MPRARVSSSAPRWRSSCPPRWKQLLEAAARVVLALSGELEPLGARRHLAVVVLVRREELDPREELGPPRHEPLEVGATEEEELAPVDGLARRRRRRRLKQAHLADELADVPLCELLAGAVDDLHSPPRDHVQTVGV